MCKVSVLAHHSVWCEVYSVSACQCVAVLRLPQTIVKDKGKNGVLFVFVKVLLLLLVVGVIVVAVVVVDDNDDVIRALCALLLFSLSLFFFFFFLPTPHWWWLYNVCKHFLYACCSGWSFHLERLNCGFMMECLQCNRCWDLFMEC